MIDYSKFVLKPKEEIINQLKKKDIVYSLLGSVVVTTISYFLLSGSFTLAGLIVLPIFVGSLIAINLESLPFKYGVMVSSILSFLLGVIHNVVFNKFNPLYPISQINPVVTGLLMLLGSSGTLILSIKKKQILVLFFLCIYFFANSAYITRRTYIIPGKGIFWDHQLHPDFPHKVPVIELLRAEPADETGHGGIYLCRGIFLLMKKGMNFYEASRDGIMKSCRLELPPASLFNYRLPTIWYLWEILPSLNGLSVVYLFWFFSCVSLIAAYFITYEFLESRFAILSPVFLFPFLLYGSTGQELYSPEYWGMFFAMIGIAFFLYQRKIKIGKYLAVCFIFLAAITREHFAYLIVAGLVSSFLLKEKRIKNALLWILGGGSFLLFFGIHYLNIKRYLSLEVGLSAQAWLFGGNIDFFLSTVKIGSTFYPTEFLPLICVIGGLIGSLLVKKTQEKVFLFLVISLPVLGFLTFLGASGSEYWGAIYMPFCYTFWPLVFPHRKE